MCTLYTVPSSDIDPLIDQIGRDAHSNNDGYSAIGVDPTDTSDGSTIQWRFQTMRFGTFVSTLRTLSRSVPRVCVHLRAATQGGHSVSNCHFFDTDCGDWVYAHNGMIDNSPYRVDSLAIGGKLSDVYPDELQPLPRYWRFANIIAVHDETGCVAVHRSTAGRLYGTPDCRSFGTNPLNDSWAAVQPGWWYVDTDADNGDKPAKKRKAKKPADLWKLGDDGISGFVVK